MFEHIVYIITNYLTIRLFYYLSQLLIKCYCLFIARQKKI